MDNSEFNAAPPNNQPNLPPEPNPPAAPSTNLGMPTEQFAPVQPSEPTAPPSSQPVIMAPDPVAPAPMAQPPSMPSGDFSGPAPAAPLTPQMSPQMTPQALGTPMAAPMQMPHKKSKAGRFILIFLLLVLLVGGGGAAAYIGYIIPNKPEYRLLKAVSNATAKSKSTALVEITAKTKENPQAATLKFQVSTDLDQKKYAISGTFGYAGMSLPIEARLINKNIYAKVSGISSLLSGMSSMFTSADSASSKAMMDAISSIDSQWFVIDSSLIESDQAASCLTGLSYKLSDADNKILENAYRKYPIVNVTSSASATVDDVKTTKYTVEPRKENLNGFGEMFKTTEIYKSAAACTAKESSTGIDEQISTAVEGDSEIGDLAFYVTGDKQLKRLEFKGTGDSEGSSFALTFKDETVNIDTPSNTKPVQDVLGTLLGLAGMYSSASM